MQNRRINRRLIFQHNSQQIANRIHFHSGEMLEVFRQNLNIIQKLIKGRTPVAQASFSEKIFPFNFSNSKYTLGEWVDVRDSNNHWSEAQICKIQNNKALIHFNGAGSNVDEWIDLGSSRISLFRSHTIQIPTSSYLSAIPNIQVDSNNNEIPTYNFDFKQVLAETRDNIESLRRLLDIYIEMKTTSYEQQKYNMTSVMKMLCGQLSVMMDRIGRLIVDISACFSRMQNPELYRDEVNNPNYNPNIRTYTENSMNINLDNRFEIPIMANNGDVCVATNIIDRFIVGDSPYIEIHVNAHYPQLPLAANQLPINLENRDNRNRNYLRNQENINEIVPRKNDIEIQTEYPRIIDSASQTDIDLVKFMEIYSNNLFYSIKRKRELERKVDNIFPIISFTLNSKISKRLNTPLKMINPVQRTIIKNSFDRLNLQQNEESKHRDNNNNITIKRKIIPNINFMVNNSKRTIINNCIGKQFQFQKKK